MAEQQRIVAVLDEVFEATTTATANTGAWLTYARQLLRQRLDTIFSAKRKNWTVEPIGDRVTFIDYRGKTPPKADTGVRLITAKNVKMGYIQRNPEEYVKSNAYNGWMTRGFPQLGDVLFTTEAPLGNVAQLDTDERVIIGQRLITMKPQPDVLDSAFLSWMLQSGPLQEAIHSRRTGATVAGIKASLLKRIEISYPALGEQKLISQHLNALKVELAGVEKLATRKLALLIELKTALLTRAFSGELPAAAEAPLTAAPANDNDFTSPEQVANVIAFAQRRHITQRQQLTFGHKKAQKALQLIEAVGGVELGRRPNKDAAGPNDFQHMLAAERWAKANDFFEFVKEGGRYTFRKLPKYAERMRAADAALAPIKDRLERATMLIVELNSTQSEVLATVHAAWNNLILDDEDPTEEAIVRAAREEWHPDKLLIPVSEFRQAIREIRRLGIVPDGSAKRVGEPRLL